MKNASSVDEDSVDDEHVEEYEVEFTKQYR